MRCIAQRTHSASSHQVTADLAATREARQVRDSSNKQPTRSDKPKRKADRSGVFQSSVAQVDALRKFMFDGWNKSRGDAKHGRVLRQQTVC
jgi:hypothetical protein